MKPAIVHQEDLQLGSFADLSRAVCGGETKHAKKLRRILEEFCPEAIHEMPGPHRPLVNLPMAKQFLSDRTHLVALNDVNRRPCRPCHSFKHRWTPHVDLIHPSFCIQRSHVATLVPISGTKLNR